MNIKFVKMQGTGNDYVYVDTLNQPIKGDAQLAVKLSDRHFGIGGDGLVLIAKSKVADAKMQMFNADGSEGNMCGNAIRCVAKYLRDKKIVNKNNIVIETKSGTKKVSALKKNLFSVNMGKPNYKKDDDWNQLLKVDNNVYNFAEISMGNPHAVVFPEFDIDNFDIKSIGSTFEKHSEFPNSTNTEFAKIVAPNTIKMRVWERGSGETLACGTGACAVAVAAVLKGLVDKNKLINVQLLGGNLTIDYTSDEVVMIGEAETVFEGEIDIKRASKL